MKEKAAWVITAHHPVESVERVNAPSAKYSFQLTQELSFVPRDTVELYKWTRFLPVSEAKSVMVRTSTQVQDDAEDNKT
jgi:hypothetical protein